MAWQMGLQMNDEQTTKEIEWLALTLVYESAHQNK
jgi:hypothetical protein